MTNRSAYPQRGRPAGPNEMRGTHSKRSIFRRTVFLMVFCGAVLFIPLIWKLWDISIVHHEEYQKLAARQQSLDYEISASRGKIYDARGNVLAMSATVYDLILSPRDLVKSVPEKDEAGNVRTSEALAAAAAARQDQVAADLLEMFPGLDPEKLDRQIHNTKSAYVVVKKDIEEEDMAPVRQYIADHKTAAYLYPLEGTKRYYPYSALAAQALGLVNDEGGAYGLEAWYDQLLEGTSGRVSTTRNANGGQLYNTYAQYIDAVDGYDLHLTIDATVQSYIEKTIEEGIAEFDVRNGAFGIAMDPNTGAVLGIASSPDFDPNNYAQITDSILNAKVETDTQAIYEQLRAGEREGLTDDELWAKAAGQAKAAARDAQWRSKAIDDTYEPGSTFKALVLAAALEEGLVSESDTFHCTGSVRVADHTIHCSRRQGHGDQTLAKAVGNSCNPAFIEIGQRLGAERFWKYFQAFGMTEETGIDLPGEGKGINWGADMGITDLAVASFGQRFTVTPLQLLRGFAAVINGGDLVKPYVVQSVTDQSGTTISSTQPEVIRQVISRQTSQRAADILEKVVSDGTGGNAYVAGYRIGGKTGSSETDTEGRTIVSFVGFAPADDPKVVVLLAYDQPQERSPGSDYCTTGVYISGGNMAAPKAGPLIAQILDYMGVEKKYSASESAAVDVSMPQVTGKTVAQAEKALAEKGLSCRTMGQGSAVARQVPAAGAQVPKGSTTILYLGDAAPAETGTVPNVTGQTYDAARSMLEKAGFFMRSSGVSVYYSTSSTAQSQSVPGGQQAPVGTVVDVSFFNMMEDGAVDSR